MIDSYCCACRNVVEEYEQTGALSFLKCKLRHKFIPTLKGRCKDFISLTSNKKENIMIPSPLPDYVIEDYVSVDCKNVTYNKKGELIKMKNNVKKDTSWMDDNNAFELANTIVDNCGLNIGLVAYLHHAITEYKKMGGIQLLETTAKDKSCYKVSPDMIKAFDKVKKIGEIVQDFGKKIEDIIKQ